MFKNISFKPFQILSFFYISTVFSIEISDLDTSELRIDFFYFLQASPGADSQTMDGDLIGRYLEPIFCRYQPNYSCLFSYLLSKELAKFSIELSISDKNKCFHDSISKAGWIEGKLYNFIHCVNFKIDRAMSFTRLHNTGEQLDQVIDKHLDGLCKEFYSSQNSDQSPIDFRPNICQVFRILNTPRHHCDFFCHIWMSSASIYRLLKYFDQSIKSGFLYPWQEAVLNYLFMILTVGQSRSFAEDDQFLALNTMLFFTYNWKIRYFERLTDIYFARSNPSSPKKERDDYVSCQSGVICPLKLIYCLELAGLFNRATKEFDDSADALVEKMLAGSNCGREELAAYKKEFLEKLTAYLKAKISNRQVSVEDYFISHPFELPEPKIVRPTEEIFDVTKSPFKSPCRTPSTPISQQIASSPLRSKRKLDFGDSQAASSPKSAS